MAALNNYRNLRIGDILKEKGYVTETQLEEALIYQKSHKGVRLGGALIAMGAITESQMLTALADSMQIETADLNQFRIELEAVGMIPMDMAQRYKIMGAQRKEDVLVILTNDPLNFYGLEDVRQITGMNLEITLCGQHELDQAIVYYYAEVNAHEAAKHANQVKQTNLQTDTSGMIVIEEGDDDAPVIQLLNSLIQRAYHNNASDIHIEPFEDKTTIRMRIDGVIVEFITLQKSLHSSLIVRIKIVGDMDIAVCRLPQDGHCRMNVDGQMVNMRLSLLPTVFGEKAVIRLLNSNTRIDHADTYGMNDEAYRRLNRMLNSPNGIIYMTGPTGSGKTTTLYMILQELAKRNVNISTIEDPVEHNLDTINQSQVNNTAGLTFETGLRALLRQDPDIIMVGETRDCETASISVRAALTGHLVLSTLHTKDAVSAIVRLEDMGVEPYMVANSLVGVVAQRLMRKLCPDCAEKSDVNASERNYLGRNITRIKRAVGCQNCNHTGYSGRIAIHEILAVDKPIREMIIGGASMERIKEYACREQAMISLRESGAELVAAGITTMDELYKVAYYD
ncbi:MAG: GspE/PulE family protein [Lachnospiraceae bacterium]